MVGEVLSTIMQPLVEQGSYYLGEKTGYNERLRQDQLRMEDELSGIQQKYQFGGMDKAMEQNTQMFDYTFAKQNSYNTPAEQLKRMKEAGLNPALMYTNGQALAQGGTTAGASAPQVGRGNAANETDRKMANLQSSGMALQLAKLKSEIDVNRSVAEANRANAGLHGEQIITEKERRKLLIENLRQEGISKWLDNELKTYMQNPNSMDYIEGTQLRNPVLKWYTSIDKNSLQVKQLNNAILKAAADAGNADAQTALTNKKVENYMYELLTARITADANAEMAAIKRLEAEFNTGETVNWKNLSEVLVKLIGLIDIRKFGK